MGEHGASLRVLGASPAPTAGRGSQRNMGTPEPLGACSRLSSPRGRAALRSWYQQGCSPVVELSTPRCPPVHHPLPLPPPRPVDALEAGRCSSVYFSRRQSRTRGGVGVRWGEGWGRRPWPPGLSPALLSLCPLSPTHSLLLFPVSTYGFPLRSASPVPAQLLSPPPPRMGLPLGQRGGESGAPAPGAPQPLPVPGISAAPPRRNASSGAGCGAVRGDGSCSCGTAPERGGGCGARGDAEPAAGTRGHHRLPPPLPACPLRPSLPPPGPALILALAAKPCEAEGESPGVRGEPGPCPEAAVSGGVRAWGGRRAAGHRDRVFYSTSCCCWVASLTT